MKFSICIPNYNYAAYIGRTIDSVVGQDYDDLELVIADNASTDRSVEVIRAVADKRIRLRINRCNVGFARNLDRAAGRARGDHLLMLSSDDLMRPTALSSYAAILGRVEAPPQAVLSSTMEVIDADDASIGRIGPNPDLWRPTDRCDGLSGAADCDVYRVAAPELLGRSLRRMKNPFNFAATLYPRPLYDELEGYGGGRLINPDKWFHWRLLGVAREAIFVDRPLFAYRWHAANQTAQQTRTQALKHLVDEYASTIEISGELLESARLDRGAFERAFLEHDIIRHGLATLATGGRAKARRILQFGRATYPWHLRTEPGAWAFAALLALGPIGQLAARAAYGSRRKERSPW